MPPRSTRKRTPSAKRVEAIDPNPRARSSPPARPKPSKRRRRDTDTSTAVNSPATPSNSAAVQGPNAMLSMMQTMMDTMSSLADSVNKAANSITDLVGNFSGSTQRTETGPADQAAGSVVQAMDSCRTENAPTVSLPADTEAADPPTQREDYGIEAIMTKHINSLTDNVTHGNDFVSVALPLDALVSDRIKAKIWADKFVDLAILLEGEPVPESYSLAINPGVSGSVSLVPNTTVRKIDSLPRWISAFQIFMTIYCQKKPSEFAELLVYQNLVKKLAAKGGNWARYDTHFRKLKRAKQFAWNLTQWELWADCSPSRYDDNRIRPMSGRTGTPTGYCARFHTTGKCTFRSCRYNHKCYKCNSSGHPASRCQGRSFKTQNQTTRNQSYSIQQTHQPKQNQPSNRDNHPGQGRQTGSVASGVQPQQK